MSDDKAGSPSASSAPTGAVGGKGQLAVIGDDRFTLGFRLAGVRAVFPAKEPSELVQAVRKARQDPSISILVMATADVARLEPRLRLELVSAVKPTLVAVGSEEDNTLRDKIKQAIGVDLW